MIGFRNEKPLSLADSASIADKTSVYLDEPSYSDVTAVGSAQFCDSCVRAFLLQSKLDETFDAKLVVEHHQSWADFSRAIDAYCPLCLRTLTELFKDAEFRKAYGYAGKHENTRIRISAIWESFTLIHTVHWEVKNKPAGLQEVSGETSINFQRIPINELEENEYIVKKANTSLSSSEVDFLSTSSIDTNFWVKACTQHHSCLAGANPTYIPPRLLDCSQDDLRLVEASEIRETHETASYVTLSHAWGTTGPHTVLDSNNIEQFYEKIPYADLPTTFKDAVEVVKKLGLQYLWIDSLCIIQKGPRHTEDWETHVRELAEIYSNCFVNIAASWTADFGSGIFRSRQKGFRKACIANIRGTLEMYEPWGYGMVSMLHLNSRAWVYQERLVSPRVLHYKDNEVFWECNELFASAKFPRGLPDYQYPKRPVFGHPLKGSNSWVLPDSESNVHVHWLSMVRMYAQCDMTKPEDRLPGISAIARKLNDAYLNSEYIVGFFKSELPASLLWAGSAKQPLHRPDTYIAPSWSWASVQGRLFMAPDDNDDLVTPFAKVKSTSIDLADPQNPYGQIKTGNMVIEGSILRLHECFRESGTGHSILELPHLKLQLEVNIRLIWDMGFSPFLSGADCLLLCIGERKVDSEYQGLIISPAQRLAEHTSPVFSRVGFWSLSFLAESELVSIQGSSEATSTTQDDSSSRKAGRRHGVKSFFGKSFNKKSRKEEPKNEVKVDFWEELRRYVVEELDEITLV